MLNILCKYVTCLNINHEVCCLRAVFKSWYKENFLQNLHFFLYYINFLMHATDSNSFFLLSSFLCSCNNLQKKNGLFANFFSVFQGNSILNCLNVCHILTQIFILKSFGSLPLSEQMFDFLLFIFPIYHGADPPHLIPCILIAKLPSTDSLFFSSRIWLFFLCSFLPF